MRKIYFLTILSLTSLLKIGFGQENSPAIPISNPGWVATDGLNRQLPEATETGAPRPNRYAGLFYYVWHGSHHAAEIYDITKFIKENPENPAYGPRHLFHWWGEPEAGYYRADDPWVIQRNLQMIVNAGIDFIYFDVTNAFIYLSVVEKVCEISQQMRQEGIPTPYIAFLNNSSSAQVMNQLYDEFYSKNKYPEFWFYWQGKPLMLGQFWDTNIRPEVKNFFTFRYSWAWTNTRVVPHHWQWIDNYPQDYGWDKNPRVPEQIPVAIASHPTSNIGESYHDGKQPPLNRYKLTDYTGQGLHFAEQWKRAMSVDPQVIMVTQWNEWVAQRFITGLDGSPPFLGNPPIEGTSFFVDAYNQEFNRDIEPMKGGHTDNHYYQLVANVRRFKGLPPTEYAAGPVSIKIDGQRDDWQSVTPVFRDPPGDTRHRNWERYDQKEHYRNSTGRNDIIASRVAYDDENLFLWVETQNTLTACTDQNWLLLFIDSDCNKSSGWEGYDFVINLSFKSDSLTSLSHWQDDQWQEIQSVQFRSTGNFLELAVPRRSLNQNTAQISFYFHWADNIQKLNDITEFFLHGESAPDRRFNYWFSNAKENSSIQGNSSPASAEPDLKWLINYPNPFNGQTRIFYQLAKPSIIDIFIYDLRGHQVKILLDDQLTTAGSNEIIWDGTDTCGKKVSCGIYFCQISSQNLLLNQKLLMLQ